MNRTVNRISEYQDRRAAFTRWREAPADKAAEARLLEIAKYQAGGYVALLSRKALTELAIREAERNAR